MGGPLNIPTATPVPGAPTATAFPDAPTATPVPPASATAAPTAIPTATRTPTPIPTATPTPVNLVALSPNVYYTEHAIYIIPSPSDVNFTGPSSFDSVYSTPNINSYVATLKTYFPDDYFFVTISARNLLPDRSPSVTLARGVALGIGSDSVTGTNVPNICRYHFDGTVIGGTYGVLDHEIGHNWGIFVGSAMTNSTHWKSTSTVTGQMKEYYSDDGFATYKQINGNPTDGFTWVSQTPAIQLTATFSDQDLYLQGLASTFPPLYVLTSPIFNGNGTVSHSGVATFDQAYIVSHNGVRNPTYQTSPKRHRIGFVYVARDLAEVNEVYSEIERNIQQYTDAEAVDSAQFGTQVPFLVQTKHRASVHARLADLNGNSAPSIIMSGPAYASVSTTSTSLSFIASDPDGPAPTVSCVPSSVNCSVAGSSVTVSGLTTGSHFYTIKAQDSGGKKSFTHFVVDKS